MTITLTTAHLQAIEEALSYQDDHGPLASHLRTDYSGRAMYGRSCVGYVGSMAGFAMFLMTASTVLIEDGALPEETISTLSRFSQDSMGHDQIFYWSGNHVVLSEDAVEWLAGDQVGAW
jgi:hypothetical protein